MLKKLFFVFLLLCGTISAENVGLLIMATGKYIKFVQPLIDSARKHFCTEHRVTYYVFTDQLMDPADDIVCFYQPRLGWPFDTMMRYHVYLKHKEQLMEQDYLFASDADMLFVDTVGNEILGKRVATLHPGFVGKRGSYESNPLSKAYISPLEGEYYFAGGFYGGTAKEMMQIATTNAAHIDQDLSQGIIAKWHDESHWNRYCIDHKPTVILSPCYCYPENWVLPYTKRLLALDKNHEEIRSEDKK